jgi:hypothetical protein
VKAADFMRKAERSLGAARLLLDNGYTCRRWRSAMRLDIVIAGAWTGGAGASEKVFGAA